MSEFDPQEFVETQVAAIRTTVNGEKALIAVSGGVDSTTCAVLTHRALGENLLCVTLDDAFMRRGEPERIAQLLSEPPLRLPIQILKVQKRFLKALDGLRDAEEKRKAFRASFYESLSDAAGSEGYRFLVQGTIRADIDETTRGIKTQHNVLSQMGISPAEQYGFQIIEPLVSIYKPQVRALARFLKVPSELSERQPFPGPGLSVRIVGQNRPDKLESLKTATSIVESNLAKHQPDQYFATILDNNESSDHPYPKNIESIVAQHLKIPPESVDVRVYQDRATGMKGDRRNYGEIVGITSRTSKDSTVQPPIKDLVAMQAKITAADSAFTRILYCIQEAPQPKPYVTTIRAIQTQNFLTAEVSEIPWKTLNLTAQGVLDACSNVSCVYYDVTPKPPATIEME